MRIIKITLLSLLLITGSKSVVTAQQSDSNSVLPGQHNLQFTSLATTWDEGIPLGNGMLGALIWQKGEHFRFSLDRADLWDLRPMENLSKPEFNWKWVQQHVIEKNYKPVQEMFDLPYDASPAPSKIPGAALEFDTKYMGEIAQVSLTLQNALCEVKWKNGTSMKTFVDASGSAGWFRFHKVAKDFIPILVPPQYKKEGVSENASSVTGLDLQRLGYEQGKVKPFLDKIVYRQKGWNGFEYEVAVTWKRSGNTLTGAWTITTSLSEKAGQKPAGEQIASLVNSDTFERAFQSHEEWWQYFWSKSAVSLPDPILEKQWYLEQYKFGSAARADAPPISLQAVWTADNGKLPPWKGDFHHDLNTQLSYWPAYSGNHLDLEIGFLNWLWSCRETFKKYTKTYFGTSGMNVPGVTTLTGEPMGGWIQYSFGPTVGCWLAQHFYLHWVFTRDEQFLRERAYPWISDVAIYLDEISEKQENGLRKLPLSSSPEIYNNSCNAWFTETTNYDLAFIRWTFEKAAELAGKLGKTEEEAKWNAISKEWPPFALDLKGGLAFAPRHSYVESHRHFSHLVGWHPLGIIDWSNGRKEQRMIRETLQTLERIGPDYWCGYSYSWEANLYARAFMGDKAAGALRIFAENFCLRNSFHVNGEQFNKGYSKFKYRPFTLEGNFAFAAAVQEMLIQSHTGLIRIFPALPVAWKEVSFSTLRCQGAFLVSAKMEQGNVTGVKIVSEKGGLCRMKNPFGSNPFQTKCSWPGEVKTEGEILMIQFPENGKVELTKQ
ncbi:MAG TPA: glycoside hydrolase N-terminal domain-containing protein [Prolixibacteraceae bacterium]